MCKPVLLSTLTLLFLFSVFANDCAAIGFTSPTSVAIAGGARAVVLADFNNDGKLDIAAINTGLSIRLGNGNGTFQTAANFATGTGPVALGVGDFNGDGKLDIATANAGDSSTGAPPTVSVLLGNGNGTFQSAHTDVISSVPTNIAIGDLNRDGKADVVVLTAGNTIVMIGNGDGTLRSEADYTPGGNAIALADFNGDGKADVVVASGSMIRNRFGLVFGVGKYSILQGNGDGTLQPAKTHDAGGSVTSLAVADINRDGKPDLVLTVWPSILALGRYSVLLNQGDGTFAGSYTGPQAGDSFALAVDVNGDGNPDLVTASNAILSSSSGRFFVPAVHVYLGNGLGQFQAGQTFLTPVLAQPLAVGKLNSDALPDIVFGTENGASVMFNASAGTGADLAAQLTLGGAVTSPLLTVFANNRGTQTATNVKVTDTLPSVLHFKSATPSQGTCSGTTTVSCNFGTLAAGAIAWARIQVSAPNGTYSFTDTATVTATSMDPSVANNKATLSFSYAPGPSRLDVSLNGTGTGTVTSSPAGINCPSTCSAEYPYKTVVTLTATPAAGSAFAGWGLACSGTGPCTVTMGNNMAVTATFNSSSGTGAFGGKVTNVSTGGGISGATVTYAGGSTATNSTGNYSFMGVATGTYNVTTSATGYVARTYSVTITAGATSTLNFQLATGGKIAGSVKTSGGIPIAGANVKLSGGKYTASYTVTTDASGNYKSTWIPIGSYALTVSKTGYTTQTSSATVATGSTTTLNFTL